MGQDLPDRTSRDQEIDVSTPGSGPQPPEQDPSQPGQPAGWGQQPPTGQPHPGQQPAAGQPYPGQQPPAGEPYAGQPHPGQQPPAGQPYPGQQPPAGQPYPGQQPPAGQPYPGQQPWGPPPGGTGAQAFGQPEQPQKKRRKWLPIVGGVVALLVVLGLLTTFLGGDSAKAGDCVNEKSDEIGVVDCDSDDAAYKVAGVVDDVSQNDLQNDAAACDKWPNSVAYAWEGAEPDDLDSKGTGYCLEELSD
jgi:hypothetical protein